ncbi:MAG: ABC transporter permease [Chloroflexi bacterium]|nr:ABC transporter permease [Chloroflexota bacterium]
MIRFVLRRLLILAGLVGVANAFGFVLAAYLSQTAQRDALTAGLPYEGPPVALQPIFQSYGDYLAAGLGQGEWGTLASTQQPITSFMADAWWKSVLLLGVAMGLAALVGIVVGLSSVDLEWARAKPGALYLTLAGFSMPGFFVGIVLIAGMLRLSALRGEPGTMLPIMGFGNVEHLILPVIALALRPAAEIARVTSELVAEELPKPYIKTARAKGLPWRLVLLRHAFGNVSSATITTLGNSLRYLISSLLIIEVMFQWPGIGQALAFVFTTRTLGQWAYQPEIGAALMTAMAAIFLIATLIADALAQAADPRLQTQAA